MRLFVGIPLAAAVVGELAALCARLRPTQDALRWAAPESWHITLQFLGNATAEQFDCLSERLAQVHSAAVPIRLGAPSVFDRPGVFYTEVELTPELVTLQALVTAATAPCGFVAEDRPYRPHITLARKKGDSGRRELKMLKARVPQQPALSAFVAREFLLYESHLGADGSRYEVRQRFSISGAAD